MGGDFTQVGSVARNNIAHILSDGSVDNAWDPNASGNNSKTQPTISVLTLSGGVLYVGGHFKTIGGQTRNGIAALDASKGVATSWNPSPDPNTDVNVASLAVSGNLVYAGGHFYSIGGQPRLNIVALDVVTGLATAWRLEGDGALIDDVEALAVSGGIVYVATYWCRSGQLTRDRLAALDANTGLLTAWNPSPSDGSREFYWYTPDGGDFPIWTWIDLTTVDSIVVSGNVVYVAGDFTRIGGKPRNRIAALDTATGLATDWNPDANGRVTTLTITDDTVYAGGAFSSIGGQPRANGGALDATTGLATAWAPCTSAKATSVAVSGDVAYIGGDFDSAGGVIRNHIAAVDIATGLPTEWNPNADKAVSALAVSGNVVYAGGWFTAIGEQTRTGIAALDTTTGLPTPWAPNALFGSASGNVTALAMSGKLVYAGGQFTTIGGQTRDSLAALDVVTGFATRWNPKAAEWNPNTGQTIYAIAASGTRVYVGGMYTFAALDATTGLVTDWDPDVGDGVVYALAISGNTMYVGGQLTGFFRGPIYGWQLSNSLVTMNLSTGVVTTWSPTVGPVWSAYCFALSNEVLYFGGMFDPFSGLWPYSAVAVSATTGLAVEWTPNLGNVASIDCVAVSASTVCVGGQFTGIGAPSNFALFDSVSDVDANGSVGATDLQMVINRALGLTIEGNADTNSDGQVDAMDVQQVINTVLGILK